MKPEARRYLHSLLVVGAAFAGGLLLSSRLYTIPARLPETALSNATTQEDSGGKPGTSAGSFATMPEEEVQSLLAVLQPQSDGTNPVRVRTDALLAFFSLLRTPEDYERAFSVLGSFLLADGECFLTPVPVGSFFFEHWCALDSAGALHALARSQLSNLRGSGHIYRGMELWAEKDAEGALKFALANPGPISHGIPAVLSIFAKSDPVRALALLREGAPDRWTHELLKQWAASAPEKALEWCRDNAPPEAIADYAGAILKGVAGENLPDAVRLANDTLTDPSQRAALMTGLFQKGGNRMKPADRIALALKSSEGDVRREILRNFPGTLGQDIHTLAEAIPAGPDRNAYLWGQSRVLLEAPVGPSPVMVMDEDGQLRVFMRDDTESNRRQAIELAREIPDGEARAELFSLLGVRWGQLSPEAASKWLSEQPPSPDRDAAIRGFTPTLLIKDPEAAMEWSASVNDGKLRRSVLSNMFSDWSAKDPVAAGVWLEGSRLTEREKATLRN